MGKSAIATKISLALGLIVAMILGSAPAGAFAAVIRSTYIVQVQEGHAPEVRDAIGRLGETPHDELTEVMDGFVIDLTDTEVAALRLEPYVMQVVADAPMSLMDTQSPVPSWGLDRIDQNVTAGDGAYNYPSSAGAGVRVYVVDTGVMASNPDFAGRMLPGVDMYGQNLEAADCQGHGTHVAGTIAGTKYGVAKKALIVPVRVLSCSGSGSWSYFISAMDWIIANNPAGTPAVMSASIGGGNYSLANAAVEKLYAAGITPVIAAGNSNVDACATSPAGAPNAITVGASDINDARASYSNWGECVDVFAPGSAIVSDNYLDPTGSRTLSGTSMATPHVSGLAALYLSANPAASPAAVTSAIKAGGLAGAVANSLSTIGNILINNSFTRASVPVAPSPVNPPSSVSASAITSTSATISWVAPALESTATAPESYKVEYKLTTDATWSAVSTATTSVPLTGLTSLSNYVVRVTGIAGNLSSTPTSELQFSTLGTAPDAPANLISTAVFGNQIDLAWNAPNSNGGAITGYYLEQSTAGVWSRIATPYGKSWIVSKLTPQTSYSFRIQAFNTYGAGAYSNVLNVTTTAATPVTPSGIVISSITATTVTAAWKASPQIDVAVPITYQVNIYSRQLYNFGALLATYSSPTNTFLVANLKRTTAYSIGIKAVSGSGVSPQSALTVFTTGKSKPTSPTSVTLTKSSSSITIAWQGPADDGGSPVTAYLVDKKNADGSWVNIANQAGKSLDVVLPARATTDYYRISAVNDQGVSDPTAVNVFTQAALPSTPQSLTINRGTSSVTLNWAAPADDGGAAVTHYAIYRSADNGTNWVALNLGVTVTTFQVAFAPKGVKYLYAVAARNSSGYGVKSAAVADETPATVPGAVRSIAFSYPTAGTLKINWQSPIDSGGKAITAYRLERLGNDGAWSVINESLALQFQVERDLPGVLVNVRVTAINELGAGPIVGANWRTPYVKASAPQNFTAVDSGKFVVTSWAAPLDLGGSAISYYVVQASRDNGTTWSNISSAGAAVLSVNSTRPTKGQTWTYRVLAQTAFGLSEPSAMVSVDSALTAPGAPSVRSLNFVPDGSMTLSWALSSDNGGSPVTALVLERSTNGTAWTELEPLAATATSANFARELPGVRTYFRIKAINEIGVSAYSNLASIAVPFIRASAPQNFVATDNGTRVVLSWSAPADLGGSVVSNYYISVSKDSGATWSNLTYPTGSATTVTVNRPAKGQSWTYRIFARTAFGFGDASMSLPVSAATTVPSAPRARSIAINSDGTLAVSWLAPTDNGGTNLTGYVLERSSDNVTWTALPALDATALIAAIPGSGPGAKHYIRVKASNEVGTSPASSVLYTQAPYLKASAPLNLSAKLVGGRLQLSWAAPEFTGGSNVSLYQLEYSADGGSNWRLLTYPSGTQNAVSLALPPKGQSYSYRIAARNAAGTGLYSSLASYVAPMTVASSVRVSSISRTGVGTFRLSFAQPIDLGGYSTYNYRVEVSINGVWTALASGVGGTNVFVDLRTPNATTTYAYRVIASNESGDSPAYTFSYRG